MDRKTQAIILGVAWFVVGGLLYGVVAGFALLGSLGGLSTPPPVFTAMVSFMVCGLPFPMLFGWIPAAYRLVKGKRGPWVSAAVMGAIAIILPIVSLAILVNVR